MLTFLRKRGRYLIIGVMFLALMGNTGPKSCANTKTQDTAGGGTWYVSSPTHRTPSERHLAHAAVAMALRLTSENCPYLWGGTGPCSVGYDCSGLVYKIYQDLGQAIPRTSQEQATLPKDTGKAGDLIIFPGANPPYDHVGIVVSAGQQLMVDAFATGTVVREEHYGPQATPGSGLNDPNGFVDPTGAS
jgi:cell wall-associated NlpC family hydrolase